MVLVLHRSILCDLSSLLSFFFFVFLGFALHNIHAFHSRLFLLFLFKNKNREKGSKMCFALVFGFEIKVGHYIFL